MALGHLGLHPHHYDEYSFKELILKYHGWDQVRAWDEQLIERQCFYSATAFGPLKNKRSYLWKVNEGRLKGQGIEKKMIKKVKVTRRGDK